MIFGLFDVLRKSTVICEKFFLPHLSGFIKAAQDIVKNTELWQQHNTFSIFLEK